MLPQRDYAGSSPAFAGLSPRPPDRSASALPSLIAINCDLHTQVRFTSGKSSSSPGRKFDAHDHLVSLHGLPFLIIRLGFTSIVMAVPTPMSLPHYQHVRDRHARLLRRQFFRNRMQRASLSSENANSRRSVQMSKHPAAGSPGTIRPTSDLDRNPGIGQAKGTTIAGEDPGAIKGENTAEGDVANDVLPTGGISPQQQGRTNK
jgi:hypothetical protein